MFKIILLGNALTAVSYTHLNQREQDGHGNVHDDVGGHEHAQKHEESAKKQIGHVDADAGVNGAIRKARDQDVYKRQQVPRLSKDFCPAKTSYHAMERLP